MVIFTAQNEPSLGPKFFDISAPYTGRWIREKRVNKQRILHGFLLPRVLNVQANIFCLHRCKEAVYTYIHMCPYMYTAAYLTCLL